MTVVRRHMQRLQQRSSLLHPRFDTCRTQEPRRQTEDSLHHPQIAGEGGAKHLVRKSLSQAMNQTAI